MVCCLQGVAELCKGLAGASGTTVLQFGKNDIGDAGVVAVADLLRANSTISEVQLHNNSISDEGVATICDALADNVSVVKVQRPRPFSPPGSLFLSLI